jgi:curli biogenesis system outer membrane secretion channel CsgG
MPSVISSIRALFTALALLSHLPGCAPTVQTVTKVAPKSAEAAALQRVAVIGFNGQNSDRVNAAFETMLVSHTYDGKPYFTVVDRARTQELMHEYGRSLRGEVQASTAAQFGKQIGAQGVYFGDIVAASITSQNFTSQESYCVRYSSSGSKCKQFGTRTVACQERIASIGLIPRLVNVESGRVVYRAERKDTASALRVAVAPRDLIVTLWTTR